MLSSVPTADFRSGDFSRMLGAHILMPAATPSGADHGGWDHAAQGRHDFRSLLGQSGRHGPFGVFSGGRVNVIPQARLNGPMMKMLALVPHPESGRGYRELLQLAARSA